MHDTAMENGERFFKTYATNLPAASVVDVGAMDINGSLRKVCPEHLSYVGVDLQAGVGVDVVLENAYQLPFDAESIDILVSSSCFEHSEMFWVVYLEIMRVLKPSGLFYLNAPSNGGYHRHPVDCWRFYPDSGGALVAWGRRNGLKNAFLESYISNPHMEGWKDFVCIFVKDEDRASQHRGRILDSFGDFTIGWVRTESGQTQLRYPP